MPVCSAELNAQRLFMCELDATLTLAPDLPVPSNFAQIVAARAESDMSGVRDGREHKRAFRFCLILALASFALLGAAASKAVFFSGRDRSQSDFWNLWVALDYAVRCRSRPDGNFASYQRGAYSRVAVRWFSRAVASSRRRVAFTPNFQLPPKSRAAPF